MNAPKFGSPSRLAGKGPAAKASGVTGVVGKSQVAQNAAAAPHFTREPGEIIFHQGDPGGDLFFIEDGEVEVFTQKDGQEVILSTMRAGEILGVMTCMTSEARMASARAKTRVMCKRVPHESIKKVLAALPNWMKIVIKEFSLRLTQMNKIYSDSVVQIRKLTETQANSLFYGAQISSAFAAVAEYFAIEGDSYKFVVIEDVLSKLESILNIEKEQLDKIFAVLLEAGLLRLEMEPDKKRTVARLESAQKLAYFAQFIKESKHGPTKKLLKARFSNKETRVMSGIVKLALRLEMNVEKPCRLKLSDLERSLEKATGIKFERECLKKGESLKLLSVEGEEGAEEVIFRPAHLGRTVACIEAIRKLQTFDIRGAKDSGDEVIG